MMCLFHRSETVHQDSITDDKINIVRYNRSEAVFMMHLLYRKKAAQQERSTNDKIKITLDLIFKTAYGMAERMLFAVQGGIYG